MRRANIFIAIIVITLAISLSLSTPVFAQSVTNPKYSDSNQTAYDLLQQEANQTGGISKATLAPLSIHTDLPTYNQGDTIVMTGHVRDAQNATAVTLRVFNELKNLIAVAQLSPSSDGSFTKTFLATGPLWKDAGNYTIIAQYGLYTNDTATFHYNGGSGTTIITQAINSTYPLQSGSQIYNIPYIIKGGTVSSMSILASQYTLEIALNTNADGSITVTLPRNMIDAKIPPPPNPDANLTGVKVNTASLEDSTFIVTVNGKQITPTETKNQFVRILSIPFHNGDSKIDIIGTVIVPEFGPIAALVLAIAIISIIAVSAKTGLRFMPKY
ncbi:MAG: PEFG-CTERM sorting domain-containing protein [Thaumarchaeota archaeon]|nr:PEFG-CTERM sorting domain-containing protein [Nitrososphaerota archaeon]